MLTFSGRSRIRCGNARFPDPLLSCMTVMRCLVLPILLATSGFAAAQPLTRGPASADWRTPSQHWIVGSHSRPGLREGGCPAIQVRNPDGNYIIPGVRGDIPYSGDLALDAYVQPGSGRRPAVIVIHGGAWTSGSRAAHVGQLLELLTRAGYHWFSIDYRLGGIAGAEQSVADVRAAVAFVRCRAQELRVDPGRLILLGEDAGADLAALLAAERPAGVLG